MMLVREEQRPGGIWILYVQGPLRVPVSRDLRRRVHALLDLGARRIVVNLAAVRDLDAGGVSELVRLYRMALGSRSVLRVADARGWVRELLDRAGLFVLLSTGSSESQLKAV